MTGLSDLFINWYRKLDGAKVYDKADYLNLVWKSVHSILRSFILSYQWIEIHILVLIMVLFFTPTCGALFPPIQRWHNLWSINLIIIQICMRPSHNSLCENLHQIQCQSWRSTLTIPRVYLLRLNFCRKIWLRLKVTKTTSTIWCVRSRIEEVESKHHNKNSQLTYFFLLMVLSVGIYIYWGLLYYIIRIMMATRMTWIFTGNII